MCWSSSQVRHAEPIMFRVAVVAIAIHATAFAAVVAGHAAAGEPFSFFVQICKQGEDAQPPAWPIR